MTGLLAELATLALTILVTACRVAQLRQDVADEHEWRAGEAQFWLTRRQAHIRAERVHRLPLRPDDQRLDGGYDQPRWDVITASGHPTAPTAAGTSRREY